MRRSRWPWCSLGAAAIGCGGADVAVREVRVPTGHGVELRVRRLGVGPDTVIVLHGGPGLHGGYLLPAVSGLVEGRTLLLYDQRGRGGSAPVADSARLAVDGDVEDLEALRAALGLTRFAVLAHHYGALVAVDYARRHPGRVSRLALVGPMVPRAAYRYELAFRPLDRVALASMVAAVGAGMPLTDPAGYCRRHWGYFFGSELETAPAVVQGVAPALCHREPPSKPAVDAINARIVTALGDWDYRPRAAELAQPVLVVTGGRDPVLLHAARTWAYRASDGRLLQIGSAPQFPWVEAGAEFSRQLSRFLDGEWPAGSVRPTAVQVATPADDSGAVTQPTAQPPRYRGSE